MKILINTISAKKNAGGAFQVSLNFIKHSLSWADDSIDWYYLVSEDIDNQLQKDGCFINSHYYPLPTQPNIRTYFHVRREIRKLEREIQPDIVYSITAPCYFSFKSREVMRFTNPWVSHPNSYSWRILSMKERIKMKFYILIQKFLIRNTKYFITQTELVKTNLIKMLKLPPENIKVVPNVLPAAFLNESREHITYGDKKIHIACIANSSKHKNLDIIPFVLKNLRDKHHITNVVFHLTIPIKSSIWKTIQTKLAEFEIQDSVITHGRVDQKELANIYRHCDMAFLPTLLEVFSASGVEAAYFNLPIIATDFDFNREIFGDKCIYYLPANDVDAADKISELVQEKDDLKDIFYNNNKIIISQYGNYNDHFKCICEYLKNSSK